MIIIFSAISLLFWYNEWKFSLPTPVPENYHIVKVGDPVNISGRIVFENNKPVFLHFFNMDCPCSRFNIPHFRSLVKQYGDKITFAMVVMSNDKHYSVEKIQYKTGLNIPVLFDTSLAVACGVYSTPQAVIIDQSHKLYFRGNYNKSRYCTDKNSNYAQMAIDSILNNKKDPVFNQFALKAYGCELPKCNK